MIDRKAILDYHIDVILTKMFEMVNLDWSNPDIKADYRVFDKDSQWYWRNEWTREQEIEFIEWLADYLYQSSGARKAIMSYPIKNKKRCLEVANWFNVNYGWKTKKEE